MSGVTRVATCLKYRKALALIVGQPEAAPRQLVLQDAVLLQEVLDDMLLLTIDESGERHEQHAQGGEVGRHGPIVPCLISAHVPG